LEQSLNVTVTNMSGKTSWSCTLL